MAREAVYPPVVRHHATLLGLVGLLLVAATPAPARAASWFIPDYDLLVEPRGDGTAHFTMRLVYSERIDFKTDADKHVGVDAPTHLTAHDDRGAPLGVELLRDARTPGFLVEFHLAPSERADGYEPQEAVIEFDQRLRTSWVWGGPIFSVAWAPKFESQLPERTHYRVISQVSSSDYVCAGTGTAIACEKDMRAPKAFDFPIEPRGVVSWARDIVPVGLAFLASGLLLRRKLRRLRADALRERGVVPEEGPVEPERQDGYRALPPRAAARLSRKDATALRSSTVVVVIGMLATFFPTVFLRRCPIPVGIASAIVVLGGAAYLYGYLKAKKGRIVLAVAPVLCAAAFVVVGARSAAIAGGAMLMVYALARTNLVLED